MKSLKKLVLKGMLAGMTMATGFGVVAPAMACTPVLAAEKEVAGHVNVYEHLAQADAMNMFNITEIMGRVLNKADDYTWYIQLTDGTYKVTYRVTEVEQESDEGWDTEKEAYAHADKFMWKNAHVEKDPETDTYTVTGDVQYGEFKMAKIENKITTINMQCDQPCLEKGQDTPIFITVDEDCDVTQLTVESCDESVASVYMAQPGTYVVVANNPGSTTIRAEATDGSGTTNCVNVAVQPER